MPAWDLHCRRETVARGRTHPLYSPPSLRLKSRARPVKTIYLLRHAKSNWDDPSRDDIDRPLSKRGRRDAKAMAEHLVREGIQPGQILCSPARRTRETLERMEQGLNAAVPVRFEKAIYHADATALLRRLRRLSEVLASVMVIGHNPALERLALMLVDSGEAAARDKLATKYPTGALATLAVDIEHWRDLVPGAAHLRAFVRPKDLGRI
ncbi:MAG: histidine phosphatase family protein [Rhodospirillales bacterium]|nr:MAG: histidine phosphatase family protein [Rhodospirillales bacterium]